MKNYLQNPKIFLYSLILIFIILMLLFGYNTKGEPTADFNLDINKSVVYVNSTCTDTSNITRYKWDLLSDDRTIESSTGWISGIYAPNQLYSFKYTGYYHLRLTINASSGSSYQKSRFFEIKAEPVNETTIIQEEEIAELPQQGIIPAKTREGMYSFFSSFTVADVTITIVLIAFGLFIIGYINTKSLYTRRLINITRKRRNRR